jgi:ABC-type phosphate transport system permease subunit
MTKSEAMGPAGVDAALFSCAAMLLIIGLLLSIASKIIEKHMRKAMGYEA